MTDKNPSQNAMEKIMRGDVKQVPRWYFVMKNIALGIVGFLCIIAGALTVSLIIFTFANSAFSLREVVYHNFLQHMIIVLPMLWIAITILFVSLFNLFVRCMKRGYRYSLWIIIGINILLSVVIGVVFYFFGVSHVVDNMLGGHFRYYHSVESRQTQLFNNPEKGMIIGHTMECQDNHFTLVTQDGKKWHVISEHIPEFKQKVIVDGLRFVVIGKKVENNIFVACDIRKRKMIGGSGQLQRRRMENIQITDCKEGQTCIQQHIEHIPVNVERMVQSACTQVQMQK